MVLGQAPPLLYLFIYLFLITHQIAGREFSHWISEGTSTLISRAAYAQHCLSPSILYPLAVVCSVLFQVEPFQESVCPYLSLLLGLPLIMCSEDRDAEGKEIKEQGVVGFLHWCLAVPRQLLDPQRAGAEAGTGKR